MPRPMTRRVTLRIRWVTRCTFPLTTVALAHFSPLYRGTVVKFLFLLQVNKCRAAFDTLY